MLCVPLSCDEDELFWSICNEAAYFPRFLSREAKQVSRILHTDTHLIIPANNKYCFSPKISLAKITFD